MTYYTTVSQAVFTADSAIKHYSLRAHLTSESRSPEELLYSRLSFRVKLHRPLGALSAAPVADVFIGHNAAAVLDDLRSLFFLLSATRLGGSTYIAWTMVEACHQAPRLRVTFACTLDLGAAPLRLGLSDSAARLSRSSSHSASAPLGNARLGRGLLVLGMQGAGSA